MNDVQLQQPGKANTFALRSPLLTPVSHERSLTRKDIEGFLDQRLSSSDANAGPVVLDRLLS